MAKTRITEDEWLAELQRVESERFMDGSTCKELADIAGVSRRTMLRILGRGLKAGRYEAGEGRRTNSTGAKIAQPVYRVKK